MKRMGLIHISKTGLEKVRSKVSSADCQCSLEISELIASAILCVPLSSASRNSTTQQALTTGIGLRHPREGATTWLNEALLLRILYTTLSTYPQLGEHAISGIFPIYERL